MSNNHTKKSWDISKATRDAVVSAADGVKILKEKTLTFGKEVQKGFKQGIAEVQKKNKKEIS